MQSEVLLGTFFCSNKSSTNVETVIMTISHVLLCHFFLLILSVHLLYDRDIKAPLISVNSNRRQYCGYGIAVNPDCQ